MFNMRLLNIRDVALIGAIVIVVHILADPLFDAIGGAINSNEG